MKIKDFYLTPKKIGGDSILNDLTKKYGIHKRGGKTEFIKLLVFCSLILTSSVSYGQKLAEDKIDKFTKNAVKRTSWEKLIGKGGMSSLYTNYRISKINENYYFELKMMMNNKIYSVNENDKIIFLLGNDETIVLTNNKFEIACKGCGLLDMWEAKVMELILFIH
jgi:hypothetical protein